MLIRNHLDKSIAPRHLDSCKPKVVWFQRHAEVVTALRLRQNKSAAEAERKRKEEDRKSWSKSKNASVSMSQDGGSFKSPRPLEQQVNEQWMRAIVKKGLCVDLVDDPEFRAAVAMTARAGLHYLEKGDPKLPHRKFMTQKVLPALDAKLDAKICKKIDGLIKETGAMLISDGWTSITYRPIINALLSTAVGSQLIKALDTSCQIKDKEFIADFICELIELKGPENIVAVCMDGACKGSFPLITARYQHVFCFVCPAHSIDNFLKNVCSDKQSIKVKSIEGEFTWGRNLFSKPIAQAWEVIKFITHHAKPLSTFRQIAGDPQVWKESETQQPKFVDLKKYCDTRYASHLIMLQRYEALRIVVEALVANPGYKAWLAKQKNEIKATGERIREIVQKIKHWEAVSLTVRVLSPALTLLRLTDGKTGATLGKVYALFANLNQAYRQEVEGIDKTTRTRMDAIFLARWTYFHDPVFTGAC